GAADAGAADAGAADAGAADAGAADAGAADAGAEATDCAGAVAEAAGLAALAEAGAPGATASPDEADALPGGAVAERPLPAAPEPAADAGDRAVEALSSEIDAELREIERRLSSAGPVGAVTIAHGAVRADDAQPTPSVRSAAGEGAVPETATAEAGQDASRADERDPGPDARPGARPDPAIAERADATPAALPEAPGAPEPAGAPAAPDPDAGLDLAVRATLAGAASGGSTADDPGPSRPARGPGAFRRAVAGAGAFFGSVLSTWREAPAAGAFAVATLAPVPLLAGAAAHGGAFAYVAFAYLTLFTFVMDELAGLVAPEAKNAAEFPASDRLTVVLAILHLLLLGAALHALAGGSDLSFAGWLAAFLAFGLWFGQVSNANAHELIHRADPRLRWLGGMVFTTLLFGHHASAHRLVHHRYVATPDDPNTAESGESFWQFAPRAWAGSFVAGWEMEKQLMRKRLGGRGQRVHPYLLYLCGALLTAGAAGLVFGLGGVLVWLALCLYAQLQLLLSDYVQHYGLLRRKRADGRFEPVGPAHSWDAPEGLSSLATLNAPRHADHHRSPGRQGVALARAGGAAPVLPHSLAIMCTVALLPPLWRRMMDHRVMALRKRGHAAF
ncbi:MAG: fatty acid desaturase, partial [Paracoccaceae bacterium]